MNDHALDVFLIFGSIFIIAWAGAGFFSALAQAMDRREEMKKGQRWAKRTISGTPYRCVDCGSIQILTDPHALAPGNCDRAACESDNVEKCGPYQRIVIAVEK